MIELLIELHKQIFFWLHSFSQQGEHIRFWLYLIAERLDWYVVFAAVVFIVLHHHRHQKNKPEFISHISIQESLIIFLMIGLGWAISYVLKITVANPRPFIQFPEILPVFLYGGYDSFPSGHATLFAALATALYIHHKRVGFFFGVCALLISLSRVISGVHFPIDILVGWVLGISSVYLVYYLLKRKKLY